MATRRKLSAIFAGLAWLTAAACGPAERSPRAAIALAPPLRSAAVPAPAAGDDRYFLVMFAAQADGGISPNTHNFAAFFKLDRAGYETRPATLLPPLAAGEATAAFAISWLPTTLPICVLCTYPFPGRNYTLTETLLAERRSGNRVSAWGPFEISSTLYDMAVTQYRRLASGRSHYALWDKTTRPQAFNCIHAVSDIDTTKAPFEIGAELGDVASEALVQRFAQYYRSEARRDLPTAAWLGYASNDVESRSP